LQEGVKRAERSEGRTCKVFGLARVLTQLPFSPNTVVLKDVLLPFVAFHELPSSTS